MMAVILNSAMLDSDTLFSSLRFTQKHSPSTLTLTQTNSIWLKLIHSHSTWWWQPSSIPPSWILPILDSAILHKSLSQINSIWLKFVNSDSTWWLAAILNSAMLDSDTLFSSLRFTEKHSHSTLTLTQTNSNWLKLIHCHSTWWWQPSWILSCWIQTLPIWIQTPSYFLSDSLKNTLPPLWLLNQTNSIWLTWWWQPSWILPCWIQTLPIWIQTPSYFLSDSHKNTLTPTLTLTQTNSIWLKLIHSHSTWWWQPSWILPSLIWPS